jgi:hypothetical protein
VSGNVNITGTITYVYTSNDNFSNGFLFVKGRSGGVQSDNELGYLYFSGYDTTNVRRNGALILSRSEAAFSTTSSPANLMFYTTASGSTTISERMRITASGRVGIGVTTPAANLEIVGTVNIWGGGERYAIPTNNAMQRGSLTIGDTTLDYGGSNSGWTTNTAGLMMECLNNTEITIHDRDHALHSFMYYAGGGAAGTRNITIGRDVGGGWGTNNIIFPGRITVGSTTAPNTNCTLDVTGVANIWSGNRYAVPLNFMSSGSLTLGNTNANFGGGSGWSTNTAGMLFECLDNTEIAVHDAGNAVASLMYYSGGGTRTVTIGRDMGWGKIATIIDGNLTVNGTQTFNNTFVGKDGGAAPAWAFNFVDGTQTYKSMIFGHDNAGNNAGEVGFKYIGAASESNYLTMGVFGRAEMCKLYASGILNLLATTSNHTVTFACNWVAGSYTTLRLGVDNDGRSIKASYDIGLIFSSNGECMRMNAGCVAMGTTNLTKTVNFGGEIAYENAAWCSAKNLSGTYDAFLWPRWTDNAMYMNYGTGGFYIRDNASNVKMYFTGAGRLGVNTTTPSFLFHVNADGTNGAMLGGISYNPNGDASESQRSFIDINGAYATNTTGRLCIRDRSGVYISFYVGTGSTATTSGTISVTGSTTNYNTTSDYRLKENVVPFSAGEAKEMLQALRPVTFNFIAQPTERVAGFIAHEVAKVVPYCVSGEKDAVNSDGSINPQGMDSKGMIPHIIAVVKEHIDEIATLNTTVELQKITIAAQDAKLRAHESRIQSLEATIEYQQSLIAGLQESVAQLLNKIGGGNANQGWL